MSLISILQPLLISTSKSETAPFYREYSARVIFWGPLHKKEKCLNPYNLFTFYSPEEMLFHISPGDYYYIEINRLEKVLMQGDVLEPIT